MKILVFSDLHLHNWPNFGIDSNTGLSKRFLDQQSILNQIIKIAKDEKIDGVICIGDIFHPVGTISTECLNTADVFFKNLRSLNIWELFVPGNHDIVNRKNPKWFHYSGRIFSQDKCPPNIKLIGFNDKIDYDKVKGFDIVAIHQTPINSKIGNYTFKEGFNWKELAKNNKQVLIGHIHQRQELAPNCIIVGSPMHLNFGDEGGRGVYLIYENSIKFIKLQYPEFKTVNTIEETKEDNNYYRVLNPVSTKINNPNIIVSASPTIFKERIQSDNFSGILKEWLKINEKPENYLNVIKDLVDEKLQLGKKIFKGRLNKVAIKNFGSIGNINYNVDDGFTLVTGNNNDMFDSNGVGKSTLFEAIYWCLFGENTKGLSGDDIIKRGQEDCEVILNLTHLNEEYIIKRKRKGGLEIIYKNNQLVTLCNETEGLTKDKRQELLESILGFDKHLFLSSCYFSQENIMLLTGLKDSERTNLITNLLGFDNYDELYEKVNIEISKFNNNIEDKQKEVDFILGKEEDILNLKITDVDSSISGEENSIKEYKELISQYRDKIKELKNTKVDESNGVVDYNKEILDLETKIVKESEKLLEINKNKNKLTDIKHSLLNNNTKLEIEKTNLENKEKEVKNKLEDYKKVNISGECDECGGVITQKNVEKISNKKTLELTDITSKLLDIESKKLSLLKEIEEINGQTKKEEKEDQDVNIEITTYRNKIKELNNKKFEQQGYLNRIESKKQEIKKDIEHYESLLLDYDKRVIEKQNNIKKLKESKDGYSNKLKEIQIKIKETKDQINRLGEEINILEFWKKAFSSEGIRSLLLDRFCNKFNKIANEYLSEISSGNMSVILTPISLLKSGEERNKIGVLINLGGVEAKYQSLSGGEKRRVDCALCFSLNKYVTNEYSLPKYGLLGIIILDEIFSHLDKSGEDNLAFIISKEGNTKAIYVIDHAFNLSSYADKIWHVNKEEGGSFIETY